VIGSHALIAMAFESVSFRISRNAEDLAQTVHALSQRLVRLEQRLEATELQLDRHGERDPKEITSLDNVERLLVDCRALLELTDQDELTDQNELNYQNDEMASAA
jgi:uncharacterized membrane protein YccC